MGRLIVFEGPDKCGKSTQIKRAEKSLKLNGYNVATFKFPNYKSPTGIKILEMLKDPAVDMICNRDDQMRFANLQIEDKFACKSKFIKLIEENDFVLLDRFIVASIVYDYVSLTSCYNKSIVKDHTIEEDFVYLRKKYDEIAEGIDAEYIFFNRSDYITNVCKNNNRDVDNLDKNDDYQKLVNDAYICELIQSDKYKLIGNIDTDAIIKRNFRFTTKNNVEACMECIEEAIVASIYNV